MPKTVRAAAPIALPIETCWSLLRDLTRATNYVPGLTQTVLTTEKKEGVGASRIVTHKQFGDMNETVTEWVPGRGFTVRLHKGDKPAAPFKEAAFRYALEPARSGDESTCEIHTSLTYALPFGPLGRLLDALVLGPHLPHQRAGYCGVFGGALPDGRTRAARCREGIAGQRIALVRAQPSGSEETDTRHARKTTPWTRIRFGPRSTSNAGSTPRAFGVSRLGSSTSTAFSAASTSTVKNSNPPSPRASDSVMWCLAGMPTTNSTIASRSSGWHTGYRDAPVRLDLSTLRTIPFEDDTLLLLGSFAGEYEAVCPRAVLAKTIERAAEMGFAVQGAFEYEFFLFDETPHSIREKGYRDLRPVTPGMFGYSVLRNSVHAEFYHDLMESMEAFDCELEGVHTETGPGVVEAAIRYTEGLAAADRAALFKTFTKVFAQRADLMATFMAKWSNAYPGQSGHLHLSLTQASDGASAFYDPSGPDAMSETMRQFVAGQVRYMPELLSMVCSTVNSYRRLVPGMWAPTASNWGVENRTCAIRVIPGSASSQRSEYRVAPADANPYLAQAAALASGLRGIEEGLALPQPIRGNAYEAPEAQARPLPSTLREAADQLAASEMARAAFGDPFVDHFVATRRWEDDQFRKQVTDYDLARYFEII